MSSTARHGYTSYSGTSNPYINVLTHKRNRLRSKLSYFFLLWFDSAVKLDCFFFLSYKCFSRFLDIFRLLAYAYKSMTVFRYLLESKVWHIFQFIQNSTSNFNVFSWNEVLNKHQIIKIIFTQFWQFKIVTMFVHDRRKCSVIFTILPG